MACGGIQQLGKQGKRRGAVTTKKLRNIKIYLEKFELKWNIIVNNLNFYQLMDVQLCF